MSDNRRSHKLTAARLAAVDTPISIMITFRQKIHALILTSTLLSTVASLQAHDSETHSPARADGHAPISIMGDHMHKKGEWMLSYRYAQMHMEGMRSGDSKVSLADVFAQGYTVAPTRMDMEMHMFGLMYAPNDQVTLMLMAHYMEIDMSHQLYPGAPLMLLNAVGGNTFETESSGWGDTKLSALYRILEQDGQKLHASVGISLPTGSIKEMDQTPRPGMPPTFPVQQLPAPMQLGSGTYDLLPALTYTQQINDFGLGWQSSAIIRLEEKNNQGYRLGHRFETTAWFSYLLCPSLSVNSSLRYRYDGQMHGTQNNVGKVGPNGKSVTTAFSNNSGGERVDGSLGANYLFSEGLLQGHRLAAEVQLPLWQNLNGLQLETDWSFTLGWQYAF